MAENIADSIVKCIFANEKFEHLMKSSPRYASRCQIAKQ